MLPLLYMIYFLTLLRYLVIVLLSCFSQVAIRSRSIHHSSFSCEAFQTPSLIFTFFFQNHLNMGIASSKDNDELVDNLVKAHQIRTKDVERAFRWG